MTAEQRDASWTLTICGDCTQAIANDDYTGLDNNPDTARARRAAIRDGILGWNEEGYTLSVDATTAGFESTPCDCCNDWRAGDRNHATAGTS